MGKRLLETEKDLIFKMLAEGSSVKEISVRLGRLYQTVYQTVYRLSEQQRLRTRGVSKRWHSEHPSWANTYSELHKVRTKDGRIVYGVIKRLKPKLCELCKENSRLLHYHHWDDAMLNAGLWLCVKCHRFAERVDFAEALNAGRVEHINEYRELKLAVLEETRRIAQCATAVKLRDRTLQLKSRLNGNHSKENERVEALVEVNERN